MTSGRSQEGLCNASGFVPWALGRPEKCPRTASKRPDESLGVRPLGGIWQDFDWKGLFGQALKASHVGML